MSKGTNSLPQIATFQMLKDAFFFNGKWQKSFLSDRAPPRPPLKLVDYEGYPALSLEVWNFALEKGL